jgi:L-lactate dehydrogenase complex protein LldG
MAEQARDAILGRLRRSLGRQGTGGGDARRAAIARLADPQPVLIPTRGDLDLEGRIRLFTAEAERVQTTVRRLAAYADVPGAVVDYLRTHNLPMRLVMAGDPALRRADWTQTLLEFRHGQAADDDPTGLTTAFAGIAETGTLMLLSGAETPTMLAFLPENAIVVLSTERLLRAYEDGFRALRERFGALPRSINFITGPSRSGDIEQTLQLGAHGPRRLLTLLVDEPVDDLGLAAR